MDLKRNRLTNWLRNKKERAEYESNPREFWDQRARAGGDGFPAEAEFTTDYIANLEPKPSIVLEYGCGGGRNLRLLEEKLGDDAQLYGCDISPAYLERAKEYTHGKAVLQLVDGKAIPFLDKFFDASFTSAVLMRVPPRDFDKLCNELIRVTRNAIIHREKLVDSSNKYRHDYDGFYKNKGYPIKTFGKPEFSENRLWEFYHVILTP